MNIKPYSAGLISQSFWFIETKKILELIASGKTKDEIKYLCLNENLLGANKEYRAQRIYGYLKSRTESIDEDLLKLFFKSDISTQKLINLFIILVNDNLFFDFLYNVYREKVIVGINTIDKADVLIFFKNKEKDSECLTTWTDDTKKRLSSSYLNFMTDANLISSIKRERIITPPLMDDLLIKYFTKHNLSHYMKAMTGEK